jgi:hypothetical protein
VLGCLGCDILICILFKNVYYLKIYIICIFIQNFYYNIKMVLIDIKLRECNLRRNTAYRYIVGDCLFDSISYLLQYEISSTSLRMNTMGHLAQCLSLNTPKAQQTRQLELNPDWLHDLHEGVYNEYQYMQKMSISAVHGGLWGDFTAIKWIADYF